MAGPLQIVVEDPQGRRLVIPFGADEIAVGRAAGSAVCLPERNVSRQHARFLRTNGTVVLEDLESSNGTLVNGERLRGRRRIREGDLVQIGSYDLAVEGSEEHPRAEKPTVAPSPAAPAAAEVPPPLPDAARSTGPLPPAPAPASAAAVAPRRSRRAAWLLAVGLGSVLAGWALGRTLHPPPPPVAEQAEARGAAPARP